MSSTHLKTSHAPPSPMQAGSHVPSPTRRLPIGAEPQPGGGVHFRVWAPASQHCSVELLTGDQTIAHHPLNAEADHMFSGLVADAGVGTRYRLRLDRGAYPDPASRYQPEGPHGPSQVVDPATFSCTDAEWRGRPPDEYDIYELHLGTFTRGGTWRSAMADLPAPVELAITVLEIMPIADFTGGFGWGYDGVNLFAPSRLYGTPDDARAFIDRAHALGLMVILDVVYNHFGPDGNHLNAFSGDYVSAAHHSEWGPTFNF